MIEAVKIVMVVSLCVSVVAFSLNIPIQLVRVGEPTGKTDALFNSVASGLAALLIITWLVG